MNELRPQCPCCGADDTGLLGRLPDSKWFAGKQLGTSLHGGNLYRCSCCRLKFRYPSEIPSTYRALYDNAEITTWSTDTARPDWDLITKQINVLAPDGGRVLDFGCYSGGLLSRLDERFERFGVEINRDAAHVAERKAGARVWDSIQEIPIDLRFDIIVMADVVEHVPNPRVLFELLAEQMADDGAIIVTTGDADATLWNCFRANWWYCYYPEHIAFISLAWVQHTLCTQGWSITEYHRFRHGHLSTFHRLADFALACIYGLAPRSYLCACKALTRWFRSEDVTSVPGNGVSADHLLITLRQGRPS